MINSHLILSLTGNPVAVSADAEQLVPSLIRIHPSGGSFSSAIIDAQINLFINSSHQNLLSVTFAKYNPWLRTVPCVQRVSAASVGMLVHRKALRQNEWWYVYIELVLNREMQL